MQPPVTSLMTHARPSMAAEPLSERFSEDLILGGRVRLRQPREGYRVAIDPVFLAAAAVARGLDRVLDVGIGVGAASLCLLWRVPGCRVTGVEIQSDLAALARENARLNGVADSVEVVQGDIAEMRIDGRGFDVVLANPPFLDPDKSVASPKVAKAVADSEGGVDLQEWIAFCCRCARPGGQIVLIHRADRLDEVLASLRAGGCGTIAVFPLWPKPGKPANRILVRGKAGSTGPLTLLPGMVMHDERGRYSEGAQRVLRHGERLPF